MTCIQIQIFLLKSVFKGQRQQYHYLRTEPVLKPANNPPISPKIPNSLLPIKPKILLAKSLIFIILVEIWSQFASLSSLLASLTFSQALSIFSSSFSILSPVYLTISSIYCITSRFCFILVRIPWSSQGLTFKSFEVISFSTIFSRTSSFVTDLLQLATVYSPETGGCEAWLALPQCFLILSSTSLTCLQYLSLQQPSGIFSIRSTIFCFNFSISETTGFLFYLLGVFSSSLILVWMFWTICYISLILKYVPYYLLTQQQNSFRPVYKLRFGAQYLLIFSNLIKVIRPLIKVRKLGKYSNLYSDKYFYQIFSQKHFPLKGEVYCFWKQQSNTSQKQLF